jgi:hypothetical protein
MQQGRHLLLLTCRWKQIQFSKRWVFLYLEFRTMGKVQKPSSSDCYTPLSGSFRFCLNHSLLIRNFISRDAPWYHRKLSSNDIKINIQNKNRSELWLSTPITILSRQANHLSIKIDKISDTTFRRRELKIINHIFTRFGHVNWFC